MGIIQQSKENIEWQFSNVESILEAFRNRKQIQFHHKEDSGSVWEFRITFDGKVEILQDWGSYPSAEHKFVEFTEALPTILLFMNNTKDWTFQAK